jgi:hypothetical protein
LTSDCAPFLEAAFDEGFSLSPSASRLAFVFFVPDLVVTCLTAAGIAGEPLLGGTGGFEDECLRWWTRDEQRMGLLVGMAGVDLAARRTDELNMAATLLRSNCSRVSCREGRGSGGDQDDG